MGGGDSVQAPQPSAAELELRHQQAALAQQQREVIQETLRRQHLLNPMLYEQQGIRPVYTDVPRPRNIPAPQYATQEATGHFVADPNYQGDRSPPMVWQQDSPGQSGAMSVAAAQEELTRLQAMQDRSSTGRGILGRFGGAGVDNSARIAELQAFINGTTQPTGTQEFDHKLTGYEKLPASETDTMQAEITKLLQTRTLSALKGDLPVDPALERNIAQQRQTLGETLQRNLGTGYATSSPGIEALSNFDKRAEELRYAARQDALSSGNAAQMGAQAFQQTLQQQRFGNIVALNNLPLTGATALGQAGNALSGPLAGYMADRQAQFQAAQANANQPDMFGQVLGTAAGIAGTYFGGPLLGAAAKAVFTPSGGASYSPFAGTGYSSSVSGLNAGGYDPWPGLTYR